MSDEPYPGYNDAVARWNVVRERCCQPGWLDNIGKHGNVWERMAEQRVRERLRDDPAGYEAELEALPDSRRRHLLENKP
jgi:hypothetical protein